MPRRRQRQLPLKNGCRRRPETYPSGDRSPLDNVGDTLDSLAVEVLSGEMEIQLEVELVNPHGGVTTQAQAISIDMVKKAQDTIASAVAKDEILQKEAVDQAVSYLYPYRPRTGQRDALHHLIYRQKDLILIAKTAFGKSMILQAVSVLLRKSITIVILPLDQIGLEQEEYIRRIGGKPCFLNSETINEKLLTQIQKGHFTHILISPELAIGDKFRTTACNPSFKSKLALVVVDEAHLVSQWGRQFRTAYSQLNQLRSFLGRAIPWFLCSATLDSDTLNTLVKSISFEADITIQRTSIDRPEILIRCGYIPRKSKFSALRFLFSAEGTSHREAAFAPHQIPKTVVFFDSKTDAHEALQECRRWLEKSEFHQYSSTLAKETIKVFHRNTAKSDKETIISTFQRPGVESTLRVIFATEALGIGVNLPDIRRVVQYGIPKGSEPAILWQRGGRASRDGLDGEMILLIDEWVKGPRSTPITNHKNKSNGSKSLASSQRNDNPDSGEGEDMGRQIQKLTDDQRRGKMPEFWYNLSNTNDCLRAQFLDHFNELDEYRAGIRKDRCCSNCNREYQLGKLDQFYLYSERGIGWTSRSRKVLKHINDWSKEQLPLLFPNRSFIPVIDCVLSHDQREELAKNAHQILSLDDLRTIVGPWRFFDTHGKSLFDILRAQTAPKASVPQGPSQSGYTWSPVFTPASMIKITPQTVGGVQMADSQSAIETATPVAQSGIGKRSILGSTSGNICRKKMRKVK